MTILRVNHQIDLFSLSVEHAGLVATTVNIGTPGARLRAARKRAELTQPQLAADTGVLQSRISELENDKRTSMDVWSVLAICKRLRITVEYLLDGTGQATGDEIEAVALLRNAEPQLRDAAMNALRGMLHGKEPSRSVRH